MLDNMSNSSKIAIAVVSVVAVVAAGYAIKKLVWDAPTDEEAALIGVKAKTENEIAKLHGEAKFYEGSIALQKAELVTYTNTRKEIELSDLQSKLERQASELASDAKMLNAMEKRLKQSVTA